MHDNLTQLARTEPDGPGRLRPVAPGLWATPDEPLGGVAMTLLNHRDEATRHVTRLADQYHIPVRAHVREVEDSDTRLRGEAGRPG